MASARDLTAGDVLEGEPATVNIGQPLSKARTVFEEHRLRTLPVVDGKQFVGMLGYRDLMEKLRSDPGRTKVDKLVHTPPDVEQDQNVVELSALRIASGRKKFAVLDKHNHLEGVVGERELVYPTYDAEELQNVVVSDLMTTELVTVRDDEPFETARRRMMDENVSRLPVVDGDGRCVGMISSLDTLRAMVPREQMQEGDYKGHKESLSDIPVRELMEDREQVERTLREEGDMTLPAAVQQMREAGTREIVVLDDDAPAGILTLKDVITHLAGQQAVEGIQVQLTGPDVPEEQQAVMDKVETALQGGLGRLLVRPEELAIHVKQYEKEGNRHKYSLRFKLSWKHGVTSVKADGWTLLDVVDEGLDNLETVVKKEREKRVDQKRDRQRKGKYSS